MLTIPLKTTTLDGTGAVVSEETVQAGLILPKAKPGQCEECLRDHPAGDPHDVTNLAYQYRFYAAHQRWPDWRDAMAHCDPETVACWREGLIGMGVDIDAGQLSPAKASR